MSLWFRNRRLARRADVESTILPVAREVPLPFDDDDEATRERLTMAEDHLIAFVVIVCFLLIICRFVFGWKPGEPTPPTFTIQFPIIPGIRWLSW
jgi:hypothetical protein